MENKEDEKVADLIKKGGFYYGKSNKDLHFEDMGRID